jgi:hypothetical protein
MLETHYSSYCAHTAINLAYIGNILSKQEKRDQAFDLYHRALKMLEDYYSSDHVEMTSILGNIGNIFNEQK